MYLPCAPSRCLCIIVLLHQTQEERPICQIQAKHQTKRQLKCRKPTVGLRNSWERCNMVNTTSLRSRGSSQNWKVWCCIDSIKAKKTWFLKLLNLQAAKQPGWTKSLSLKVVNTKGFTVFSSLSLLLLLQEEPSHVHGCECVWWTQNQSRLAVLQTYSIEHTHWVWFDVMNRPYKSNNVCINCCNISEINTN